jgi:hypothetical protein
VLTNNACSSASMELKVHALSHDMWLLRSCPVRWMSMFHPRRAGDAVSGVQDKDIAHAR